jgi:3-methyladenine DNA glycosylase Tag
VNGRQRSIVPCVHRLQHVERLAADARIIRNRRKIEATLQGKRAEIDEARKYFFYGS